MIFYLVCFDIGDDRVRTRVARHLGRYGDRVQYSVFEVAVRGVPDLDRLRRELAEIAGAETEIRFYRLCHDCREASRTLDGDPVARFVQAVVV